MDNLHHLLPQQALTAVDSTAQGLSLAEAARRLDQHGPNLLTPAYRRGLLLRFLL